jgi:hypothetical protein
LWSQTDQSRDSAEKERESVAQDSYIDDQITTMVMMLASLVQQGALLSFRACMHHRSFMHHRYI